VAHVVGGALRVATHAWGVLGELHAFVHHTGHSSQTVSGRHAGLGSGEMAHAVHAAAHRLAHRVICAGALFHHEFRPVSRAAQLHVHAALAHGREGSAVGITGAAVHVLGLHGHDLSHPVLVGAIHVHHVGSGQADEENEDD